MSDTGDKDDDDDGYSRLFGFFTNQVMWVLFSTGTACKMSITSQSRTY